MDNKPQAQSISISDLAADKTVTVSQLIGIVQEEMRDVRGFLEVVENRFSSVLAPRCENISKETPTQPRTEVSDAKSGLLDLLDHVRCIRVRLGILHDRAEA